MTLWEMRAKLDAAKVDLDNATDAYRREPSDQRLGEVLDTLLSVVGELVGRSLTTEEDRP